MSAVGLESKHMDSARARNFNIQRKHLDTIQRLNKEWEISRSKILTEQKYMRKTLDEIKLGGGSGGYTMVMPRGLTDEQKILYTEIHTKTPPSISLGEFDRQMAHWKATRQYARYEGQALFCRHVHPNTGSHYLSPNKSLQLSGMFRLHPEKRQKKDWNQGVTRPQSAIPGTGPPRVRRGSSSFGPRRSQAEVKAAELKARVSVHKSRRTKSTMPGL